MTFLQLTDTLCLQESKVVGLRTFSVFADLFWKVGIHRKIVEKVAGIMAFLGKSTDSELILQFRKHVR